MPRLGRWAGGCRGGGGLLLPCGAGRTLPHWLSPQTFPGPTAQVLNILGVTWFREHLIKARHLLLDTHTHDCRAPWIPGSAALCLVPSAGPHPHPPASSHRFLAPPEAAAQPPPHSRGQPCPPLPFTWLLLLWRGLAHLEGVEEVPEGPGIDDVVVHGEKEGDHHASDTCREAVGAEDPLVPTHLDRQWWPHPRCTPRTRLWGLPAMARPPSAG